MNVLTEYCVPSKLKTKVYVESMRGAHMLKGGSEMITYTQSAQSHHKAECKKDVLQTPVQLKVVRRVIMSTPVLPILPPKYSLERIKNSLFEGDCLSVLSRFPDSSIDMVLCDLPYGTTQNKWDSVIDLKGLWKAYERVVKPNGAVVLTSQGIFTAKLILSNERFFKYKLAWEKSKPTNFLNAKKQPLRKHEDVCVFYRKQPTYNPQMGEGGAYDKGVRKDQLSGSYGDFLPRHVKSNGGRYPTDVVYFKTAESEGTVWHPTQKPVE